MTWLVIFVIWLCAKTGIAGKIFSLIKAFLKLWKIFLSAILYVIGIVFLLYKLHFWNFNTEILKTTILWFLGSAMITIFHVNEFEKDKKYFKKIILESISLTVAISFLTSFYTFPFFVEIIILPIITLVAMLGAYSEIKKEQKINKIMNWIIILFGLVFLTMNLIKAIADFKDFATYSTLQEFLLPIVLSMLFLPYLYLLYTYMAYVMKRVRARFMSKG